MPQKVKRTSMYGTSRPFFISIIGNNVEDAMVARARSHRAQGLAGKSIIRAHTALGIETFYAVHPGAFLRFLALAAPPAQFSSLDCNAVGIVSRHNYVATIVLSMEHRNHA